MEERQVELDIADFTKWASKAHYLDGRGSWYETDDPDEDDVVEISCGRLWNTTFGNATGGTGVIMPARTQSSVSGYDRMCGRIRDHPKPYKISRRPVARARAPAIGARRPPLLNSYLATPRAPG